MNNILSGITPVAPTPFHDDGSVDYDGMRRVLDCMMDQGVDGICILANYSEQFLLTDDERAALTRLCLEHVNGRKPLIVTISHFSTDVVVARARECQAQGAAMLMMMPPYHGVGITPNEQSVFEHFSAVNNVSKIPIMVQDAPLSGINLRVELLTTLAQKLEHVRYFKIECGFAADKIAALIASAGAHIDGPFDGEEAVTLLADLDAGATGTMTSALFPEKIRPIVTHYLAGETDEALRIWTQCLPLINHENRQCGLRACKSVFKEGGVIGSDRVRHPLQPLSGRTRERLISLAQELDILALTWGH